MAGECRTYVFPSPPKGFVWQVSRDGKILKSGLGRTEAEASTAAESIADKLEAAEAKKEKRKKHPKRTGQLKKRPPARAKESPSG